MRGLAILLGILVAATIPSLAFSIEQFQVASRCMQNDEGDPTTTPPQPAVSCESPRDWGTVTVVLSIVIAAELLILGRVVYRLRNPV